MNRYLRQRRRAALPNLARGANLVNAPTVAPITGANGQGIPVLRTDPYIAIEIDTTDAAIVAAVDIVLFDASRGYQLGMGYAMPAEVVITGLTADYQFILNDMSHNASYFDIIKQQIDVEAQALIQYGHPIKVYEGSKGSSPKLVDTIHPSMGVHEGQFQKTINSFEVELIVTNRTALVFKQQPGIKQVIGFYQKAELGRKI